MYKFAIVLATLVLVSCDRDRGAAEMHDHAEEGHAHKALQSTLYSGEYEYFIEYDAPEAGRHTSFLVHVTDLETYSPVEAGSLTIRLGDHEVKADAPARPGIFEMELEPEHAGNSAITYTLDTEDGRDLVYDHITIGNDHGNGEEHVGEENSHDPGDDHDTDISHGEDASQDHDHEAETGHLHSDADVHDHGSEEAAGPETGEITFLKEQAWNSDFMVREIAPAPFSAVIRSSGQVLAVPGQKKHLPAKSSGVLLFSNDRLVEGSWVEQGEVLFILSSVTLDDSNFELRYRELKNNLQNSRSVYHRHQELYAEQIIPEKQLIGSRTTYINDSLRFYNLAERASAGGMQIISPISGYIHELNYADGQYVKTGDQVVTISSNKKLLLRADVPMQHYPVVREIESANFRSAYSDRMYNTDSLNGVLLARGSSVAENDHFIPVYFEVENDGTLLEGAYVEFFLKTAAEQQALLVPESAILEEAGNHYLYVQVTGESYTKQPVTTGRTDGKSIEITGGLHAGARVVTRGVMLLKATTLVTGETGHGHAH